jgi:hypothetical protein
MIQKESTLHLVIRISAAGQLITAGLFSAALRAAVAMRRAPHRFALNATDGRPFGGDDGAATLEQVFALHTCEYQNLRDSFKPNRKLAEALNALSIEDVTEFNPCLSLHLLLHRHRPQPPQDRVSHSYCHVPLRLP